jgi:hypothetical protein
MFAIKPLIFSVLVSGLSGGWVANLRPGKCDDLALESKLTQVEGKGIKAEITVKGGSAPYKYLFYKESGHLLAETFDANWVDGLEKGRYSCTVIDNKGCYKTIELEIK